MRLLSIAEDLSKGRHVSCGQERSSKVIKFETERKVVSDGYECVKS